MSVKRLYDEIAIQHQSGNVKYPYAIEQVDNKQLEFELVDNNVHQTAHVNIDANRVHFKLLLKRFNNLFGDDAKFDRIPTVEYEWLHGLVLVGFKNEDDFGAFGNGMCLISVQIEMLGVSNELLTKFLNTQITIENVASVIEELYKGSYAYKGDDVLLI